jgi:hypothetical protein
MPLYEILPDARHSPWGEQPAGEYIDDHETPRQFFAETFSPTPPQTYCASPFFILSKLFTWIIPSKIKNMRQMREDICMTNVVSNTDYVAFDTLIAEQKK